ncbi:MAG: DNA primase [Bacteroidota bacterium]
MIPKETIEKIFETARVEEVIGDFITLKKRGVNFIGLCPFHNEKTPSFTVSPAKGIYKCFGCSAGGNAVNFVMEHEHMSYPEALRYLAKKYNIHIEEEALSPEQIQQDNERESLFVVSSFAQKHFTQNLFHTEEGQAIGLSYFKERGFNHDTIEKFQLGYAMDKTDGLLSEAKEKGYNPELLEKTGLIKNKDGWMFDFFRGRVIFPVHNVTGKVIAFGARTLKSDKKEPKYLNSPETEIYVKSKILYGIFHAKKSIIQNDNCFLVEGYTDVISMFQAGIENVVASSGTSLTTEQIRLIKRYTPNITILYDGDAAGIKASFRGIDMILEEGMNVKVLLFPDGEDPDSFSKKVSTDELKKFIAENTKDFIFFKTGILLSEAQNDPVKKAGLIKELVHSIALIPDPITRSVYTKECSRLFEMNEQTLINELNKSRRANYSKQYKEDVPYSEPTHTVTQKEKELINELYPQEQELTRILLNYSTEELIFTVENENGEEETLSTSVAEFILHELHADELEFEHPEFAGILDEFKTAYREELILTQKYFLEKGHDSSGKTAIDMIFSPYQLSEKWVEKHKIFTRKESDRTSYMVRNAVYSYKLKKVMQVIYKIQEQLKTETNEEMIQYLLEQNTMLLEIKKLLSAELGRVMIK